MTIRLALAFTALLFFQYFLDLLALRSVILVQIIFYMDALTRDLFGSRVLIINKTYKDEYGEIKGINALKKYSEILSFGWPEK